jgi:hypothetical protein
MVVQHALPARPKRLIFIFSETSISGDVVDMDQKRDGAKFYICPMHKDVRQPNPGKCPKCGMDLVPEGTRFAMLQHIITNPRMLTIMLAVMLAVLAAVMMMTR